MSQPIIRPFEPADTDACYEICLRTGFNGSDASHLHTDPRILGEVWVGPYLALMAEFAVVVEDAEGVGGYIVGAADTVAYDDLVDEVWFPPLRERYPVGTFPAGTADGEAEKAIHTPPRMPAEITGPYPAHLHIDLLPRLQGRGVGRQMIGELFSRVRSAGADAIHLGCSPDNTNAIAFYRHLGFEDLMGGFLWGRSTDPV